MGLGRASCDHQLYGGREGPLPHTITMFSDIAFYCIVRRDASTQINRESHGRAGRRAAVERPLLRQSCEGGREGEGRVEADRIACTGEWGLRS